MAASESELAIQESRFVPAVNPPAASTLNPLCQRGVSSDCPGRQTAHSAVGRLAKSYLARSIREGTGPPRDHGRRLPFVNELAIMIWGT